jgi:uncharacterized coiled-coil DUF342 family protein
MSTSQTTLVKEDFLTQIWEISTTLTEEAMAAASSKAAEAGFDPNRGVVSLQESFINLSSARAVLEDAIDKKKLIQLPITVQKELLTNLQGISKALQGLINGIDEIANLTNAIENLNTAIWKFGLHNLSDQVLGYQTKLNQLKNQELQISKVRTELRSTQAAAESANAAASEIALKTTGARDALEQTKKVAADAVTLLEEVKESANKINAVILTVQQNEKQSGEMTSTIKTANNELLSLDTSIRKFYSEVDEYRKRINDTSEQATSFLTTSQTNVKRLIDEGNAKVEAAILSVNESAANKEDELAKKIETDMLQARGTVAELTAATRSEITEFRTAIESKLNSTLSDGMILTSSLITQTKEKIDSLEKDLQVRSDETIGQNHAKTQDILAELDALKGQVKEQIQQATGFTLFGAFQSRQNQVAEAKRIWAYAVAALVLISVGVTAWIAYEAQQYTTHSLAFYVKLSLTIPLAFAITFCALQYSRERRLEEEYAFKASISVSLNPYKDLVQAIIKEDKNAELGKYTEFVIDSVKNVFTSPTDKVFDVVKKSSGISEKAFKQAAEIIGTGVKAAKS